jgi:RNA polymerase sigma factor (sigma-70 family)
VDAEQSPADDELLRAWQRGDRRAGGELIRRHTPRLHRFFANKVASGAEDLCQQTWAACTQARDRIDDDGGAHSFAAYLFTAARNKLLNHYRQQTNAGIFDPLTTTVASLTGGQSAVVEEREDQQRLRIALQSLPLDAQITLELHYWEHLSIREIADVLAVAEGTIKARLSRARRQLHDILHPSA